MDFAREDLTMASLALEAKLFNQTCFHAQQCCEKCLKALAHEHIGTPPKTHKIADLLTILNAFVPSELADRIRLLDRFAQRAQSERGGVVRQRMIRLRRVGGDFLGLVVRQGGVLWRVAFFEQGENEGSGDEAVGLMVSVLGGALVGAICR